MILSLRRYAHTLSDARIAVWVIMMNGTDSTS